MHTPTKTRRARTRGMTLIEIMVVITIIGMIASAVGVNVVRAMADARVKQARTDVSSLSTAANAYIALHGTGRCPTLTLLRDERFLSEGSNTQDPWEHAYTIDCDDRTAQALSAGPDGEFDTADDI